MKFLQLLVSGLNVFVLLGFKTNFPLHSEILINQANVDGETISRIVLCERDRAYDGINISSNEQ